MYETLCKKGKNKRSKEKNYFTKNLNISMLRTIVILAALICAIVALHERAENSAIWVILGLALGNSKAGIKII